MRIIPTRVGTSDTVAVVHSVSEDHPHACGDKQTVLAGIRQRMGSSPRVWGQAGRSATAFA